MHTWLYLHRRKAQEAASSAAAAAGSGNVLYLIQCSRSSCVEEYDEDLYVDCHGEENDAVEHMVRDALRKLDGTWLFNATAPGSKQQQSSSGIALFSTLEAANELAGQLFKEMLANPPFDGEADDDDEEEEEEEEAEKSKLSKKKAADGRVKWEATLRYNYDPLTAGQLKNVVESTLVVKVVPATVC